MSTEFPGCRAREADSGGWFAAGREDRDGCDAAGMLQDERQDVTSWLAGQ
jgi:hypothetical protein